MSATRPSDPEKKTAHLERTVREMAESRGKVTCSGTFGGYDVTGWRYIDTASWHVKVWLAGRPSEWIGYTVTAGAFEVKMFAKAQKEAVLQLIGQWEAE
jgi:hypothetical protein